MRKPRDYDAELKALDDKARQLRSRKLVQFGELVVATGADALDVEQLAGALIAAVDADAVAKEAWRKRGLAFFQRTRGAARTADSGASGELPLGHSAQPPVGTPRAG